MHSSFSVTPHYAIRSWLIITTLLVVCMIFIGAITRLTDSGLSMVEWRPLYGFLPPLSEKEWMRIFTLYQQIPEYRYQNFGMTLDEFKTIFWWEYIHRLWGRVIGLVYTIPLAVFWLRGMLPPKWKLGLFILFVLGGAQGGIGWWMVKSGLSQNLDVSALRLMIHLGMALLIICGLWLFVLLFQRSHRIVSRETLASNVRYFGLYALLWPFVFIVVLSGALVAGNNAGLVYTDWPLMGGQFVPTDYAGATIASWWESPATVQFHHRMLAYMLFVFIAIICIFVWLMPRSQLGDQRSWLMLLLLVTIQAGIGIATLWTTVHTTLAIAHHINAIILLLTTTTIVFNAYVNRSVPNVQSLV